MDPHNLQGEGHGDSRVSITASKQIVHVVMCAGGPLCVECNSYCAFEDVVVMLQWTHLVGTDYLFEVLSSLWLRLKYGQKIGRHYNKIKRK